MSFKVDKRGDVMCIPIQALDTWQVKDKIEFFGDYEIEWFVEVLEVGASPKKKFLSLYNAFD